MAEVVKTLVDAVKELCATGRLTDDTQEQLDELVRPTKQPDEGTKKEDSK